MLKTSQDPVTETTDWYLSDLSPALQQSSCMAFYKSMHFFSVSLADGVKALTTPGFCGPDVQTGIYHSVLCSCLAYRSRYLSHGNQDEAEEASEYLHLLLVPHHDVMKACIWTWKLKSSLVLLDWKCQIKPHKLSPLSSLKISLTQ